MAKKTKEVSPVTAATAATPATPATPKTKKVKVEVPLTPAQQAAKEAMDKANADARAELLANSAEKIAAANQKIKDAQAAVTAAKAELKALNKAVGVKGVFGGKKASTLTYKGEYPEGKGAPQARAILAIVKTGKAAGLAREAVVTAMKDAIKTNMDRSRLLSYYTSRMVADGVITIA
jgi:hypothetical protein